MHIGLVTAVRRAWRGLRADRVGVSLRSASDGKARPAGEEHSAGYDDARDLLLT